MAKKEQCTRIISHVRINKKTAEGQLFVYIGHIKHCAYAMVIKLPWKKSVFKLEYAGERQVVIEKQINCKVEINRHIIVQKTVNPVSYRRK